MIDYSHPPLWYCILFVFYTTGLILTVRNGIQRRHELSRTSYVVRVYGAGFLALVALSGVALQVWIALHRS
jgi:ABC-type transport system involved in cytochrome c biogenesis permease subunit